MTYVKDSLGWCGYLGPRSNDSAMKTILIPIDFQPAAGKVLHYIEKVFKDQSINAELLYVYRLQRK